MPEPVTVSPAHHVFVYGTLRRGCANDITRLQPAPRFVAMASLAGTLYDLGPYPGLLLQGDALVQGEVYAITAELEQVLDRIEEIEPSQSSEYFKRVVPVTVQGQAIACIVYEVNAARVLHKPVIVSGDWTRRA
jgi:gamma-glutamylcyclotransferase (GGCT)/AIG2-like uncharacterized protein YtfP